MVQVQDYQAWFEVLLPRPIRWCGDEGKTLCPFHDDKKPSLSVNRADGVFYCHGCGEGGKLEQLARKLGVAAPNLVTPDVSPKSTSTPEVQAGQSKLKKSWSHAKEYVYHDEDGSPVLLVGVDGTGESKRVRQYHRDGEEWFSGAANKKVPYNLAFVLDTVSIPMPIYMVEGEKDVETLGAYMIAATTNPCGARKWPKDEQFNGYLRGADVIIIPDNDEPGRIHANQVAESLKGIADRIRILNLPGLAEKGDVTDWVEDGGDVTVLEKMADDPQFAVEVPTEAPEKQETMEKQSTFVVEDFFDKQGRLIPSRLGKMILEHLPTLYYKGIVYVYDGGVYLPNQEMKIKRFVQKILGEYSRSRHVEEVLKWIINERYVEPTEDPNPHDGYINVKNGLLDWRNGELKPHTPERFSSTQIRVNYDPNARSVDIEQFFHDVLPDDVVQTMYEIIGYCLIPTTMYQKAFMFTGDGANGKSTLINLLTKLVGEDNTTNIPIHELEQNRFKLALLRDKLVNTFADLQYSSLDKSSTVKSLVVGDRVNAEYKGKDGFDFTPFVKLIFSANELPSTRDVSKAFFRRWIVIPFPYSFGYGPRDKKADPTLEEKLKTPANLSALLNLAIDGLRRLERRGRFEDTPSTRKALEDYILDIDSVAAFIEACVTKTGMIGTTQLYMEYERWCHESGVRPVKKIRFNKRLKDQFPELEKRRNHTIGEFWGGISVQKL